MCQWIDVTEGCRVLEWKRPYRETPVLVVYHGEMLVSAENGYRINKVMLWTVQPHTNILGEMQHAFIVERRS